jgi:hypothetical protein
VSSLELQKAIVARLKADAGVVALVGQRIYDQPPIAPVFPYISLGPDQTLPDRADCYDGSEVNLQVDAWSRAVGFPEVKRIAEAARAALQDAPLSLAGHRLVDLTFVDGRTLRDPDGLTSHAAMTFRALTEPVD